jgi:solute carrier family 66, member 2
MAGVNAFLKNSEITGEKNENLDKDSLFNNLNEPLRYNLNLSSLSYVISFIASGFMIFGGIVPYIPQYRIIQRSRNATGFSNLVCLALLIANILRILFWFGHPFELPLLIQSLIMILTMLIMLELCIRVNTENLHTSIQRKFTDFDAKYFWKWSDFKSYLHFLLVFTLSGSVLTYLMLEVSIFIETLGMYIISKF